MGSEALCGVVWGVQYSWQAAQLFNNVSSGDDQLTGKSNKHIPFLWP